MTTTTTAPAAPTGEVLEVGAYIADMGHRPVCTCGWVGRLYALGYLPTARAALRDHAAAH